MPLWSNTDANTGAPKTLLLGKNIAVANATVQGTIRGTDVYQNTQVGVFVAGQQLGIFGVDAAEKANTQGDGRKPAHAGWVLRRGGTGFIQDIAVANGGSGYTSNGFIVFTGGGGSNANVAFTVNAANSIIAVTLVNRGAGYNGAPTAAANLTNTGPASFTITMGGRTGRVHYETLVAMGSMLPGANTDNAYFPE